jgi:DNA-binding NtrC family response regulator
MQAPFRIFIVEDENWYGQFLQYHLSLNPDYEVHWFTTGRDCLQNMALRPAVVTVDYTLPDMTGAELMARLQGYNPKLPIIIISGQEELEVVVQLLKKGAYDYIVKNDETRDKLWNTLLRLRERADMEEELDQLKEAVARRYDFSNLMLGGSEPMQKVFRMMEKAARTNISVSVTGETGTGKELVAQGIHYNSERAKKPFVAVNMAAIPAELLESELFGYEKGAFTGATARKRGQFEAADGGTLFLDEIAEMALPLQAKILRALQEREITRLGGTEPVKFDLRLIVATHRKLEERVRDGQFREDLYYRILGLGIGLPPLRARGNDILLMARTFADQFAKANKLPSRPLGHDAKQKLLGYHWPGNVRELKAVMELAVVMAEGEAIEADDITFRDPGTPQALVPDEALTLRQHEQRIIQHYLDRNDRNVMAVAKKLDIGKSKIYQMIKDGLLDV